MWPKWLQMKSRLFLGVKMSKRYMLILILINALKRMSVKYRIIGSSEPQDRDTIIVLGEDYKSVYLKVTNDGVETTHPFFPTHDFRLQVDTLISTAMAAIDVQIAE